MSSSEQDDENFIENQRKKLVLLKKIAEQLHDKKITENCFIVEDVTEYTHSVY